MKIQQKLYKLWFDVGIKRYTTDEKSNVISISCGLMQESKDIQLNNVIFFKAKVVV